MTSANSRSSGGTIELEMVQEWQRLQSSSAGERRKPYRRRLASRCSATTASAANWSAFRTNLRIS